MLQLKTTGMFGRYSEDKNYFALAKHPILSFYERKIGAGITNLDYNLIIGNKNNPFEDFAKTYFETIRKEIIPLQPLIGRTLAIAGEIYLGIILEDIFTGQAIPAKHEFKLDRTTGWMVAGDYKYASDIPEKTSLEKTELYYFLKDEPDSTMPVYVKETFQLIPGKEIQEANDGTPYWEPIIKVKKKYSTQQEKSQNKNVTEDIKQKIFLKELFHIYHPSPENPRIPDTALDSICNTIMQDNSVLRAVGRRAVSQILAGILQIPDEGQVDPDEPTFTQHLVQVYQNADRTSGENVDMPIVASISDEDKDIKHINLAGIIDPQGVNASKHFQNLILMGLPLAPETVVGYTRGNIYQNKAITEHIKKEVFDIEVRPHATLLAAAISEQILRTALMNHAEEEGKTFTSEDFTAITVEYDASEILLEPSIKDTILEYFGLGLITVEEARQALNIVGLIQKAEQETAVETGAILLAENTAELQAMLGKELLVNCARLAISRKKELAAERLRTSIHDAKQDSKLDKETISSYKTLYNTCKNITPIENIIENVDVQEYYMALEDKKKLFGGKYSIFETVQKDTLSELGLEATAIPEEQIVLWAMEEFHQQNTISDDTIETYIKNFLQQGDN